MRLLLLALTAVLGAFPAMGAGAAHGDSVQRARLVAALRVVPPDGAPSVEFLAQARGAAPELFAVLRDGVLPAPRAAEAPARLSAAQERWILDAVRTLERREVLALARGAVAASADARTRIAAIRCIGTVAHAGDLDELFGLALADGEALLERRSCEALEHALGELFARDERALAYVLANWRSLREPLIEPLVLAAARVRGAPALEFLAELIRWRTPDLGLALAKVQELGRSLDPGTDERARACIRPLLDPRHGELCRAAALALGALGDHASIPELIALFEEGPGLRANAHWALRRITGLGLPASAEPWQSWYRRESTWCEDAGPAALARLRSPVAGEVADAVRALSAHPLAREELALALLELLESEDSSIRILACRALPGAGDARAFPGLLALLEDTDAEVAAAALEALRALTGRDLPPESEAWEALLARG